MNSSKTKSTKKDSFYYSALPEPIPITEQVWPEGTRPLVCTRHMTYNHENYIRECIDGVLMQKTTFPVRVCIHDDASTDKTAEIVREYQEKYPNLIWAYYQKENTFRHPNRAEMRSEFMGWAEEGKYQAICEGDDYWTDPYKLEKQVSLLISNNADACYSFWREIREGVVSKKKYDNIQTGDFLSQDKYHYFHTTTRMYRTEFLKKIRTEYPKELKVDTPIQYLALMTGLKIVVLAEITSMYRRSGYGIWTSLSTKEQDLAHIQIFSLLGAYIPQKKYFFFKRALSYYPLSKFLRSNKLTLQLYRVCSLLALPFFANYVDKKIHHR